MRTLLLALLALLPAAAFANTPKQAFRALNACVQENTPAACRDDVTASSIALYDRFASHGLTRCLPKDAAYVSESKTGAHRIIRARTDAMGATRYMRLYFVEEEGKWKLDVPASLERSMGKNWQKQVDMAEQLYLALNAQAGGSLSCAAVQGLAAKR